jgi:hypothetical protein
VHRLKCRQTFIAEDCTGKDRALASDQVTTLREGFVPRFRIGFLAALLLSLAFHASLLLPWWSKVRPPAPEEPMQLRLMPRPEVKPPPKSKPPKAKPLKPVKPIAVPDTPLPPAPEKAPLSMPAPPAPTAEEWKIASTYTLKNSKRYRYNWGQQVRSMMGTAVEGPGQGVVRFRIEIAPDGKIAKVEELWSTSELASELAWNAIRNLPPLPPTPTGKPLVFEQTISFLPYETGWPPSYKLDCLPDPPIFKNQFAWDGASPRPGAREYPESGSPSGRAPPSADCDPDSTADSIEEEERELKRQMELLRWGR